MTVFPQPPYSPDLASDFFLFLKLKSVLKVSFDTIEEIKTNSAGSERHCTNCLQGLLPEMETFGISVLEEEDTLKMIRTNSLYLTKVKISNHRLTGNNE